MNTVDVDYLRHLVREHSAIVVEEGKEYLFQARLLPVVRLEGLASIDALVQRLRSQPYNGLHQKVVEAMTTNETSFFRDSHPFETLKNTIFPELIKKRAARARLDIWSAACSSGQEAYSIGMILRENFPELLKWNVKIVGTDLSNEILERARKGRYNQFEVNRGLPAPLLVKYFTQQGVDWQITDSIRKMAEFIPMNLIGTWPPLLPMDIIMLRNVLIYFDLPTKKSILSKIRFLLKPDGYLFLGGAETTNQLNEAFEPYQIGKTWCYRLRGR